MVPQNSLLLKLAEEDLEDASLLFSKKRFRNAIFLLQQADEKGGKGVLQEMGLIVDSQQIAKMKTVVSKISNGKISKGILDLIETMQPDAPEKMQKALKLYGHDWQSHLVSLLGKWAPSLALAASDSGILAHFKKTIEIDDPRFGTDWKPEDFNERAENAKQFVKNAVSSQAFRNPTVDMLEQEIRDCYKVLDSPKKLKEALPGMKEAIESLVGKDFSFKDFLDAGCLFLSYE